MAQRFRRALFSRGVGQIMSMGDIIAFVPAFVLVFFRVAGFMIFAPLFGSSRIPRRVRLLLALVLAAGISDTIGATVSFPENLWQAALGIGGEITFGFAMGMILSFTFVAAQWAGEMIGQQMGLNLSEVFDPQFGQQGSLVGDLYFMITLAVFLAVGGHRAMIESLRISFTSLPLLSLGIDRPLLDTCVGLFESCTTLAVALAAPMLVTMLVVDLALGCIGKAMPQMNIFTTGLSVRSLLGLVVVVVGLTLTVNVLQSNLIKSIDIFKLSMLRPTGT